LLHYLHRVFEKDLRGQFERSLLDNLQWTTCTNCGIEHARNTCPNCLATIEQLPLQTVRETVTATRLFSTQGIILFAILQQGELRWIYHERGEFKREDGSIVLGGQLDTQLRYSVQGKSTLIGKQGQLITLTPGESPSHLAVDTCGSLPMFDASESSRYWIYNSQLLRDGQLGAEYIGDVLAGQTRFWVGSDFGFGFYRAGTLSVAFVFDAQRRGINDSIQLPPWQGQIIDATCSFSNDRCWFFLAIQEQGRIIHRCAIIQPNGKVEATARAELGDGSWLGTLRGKCAVRHFLLAATDDGIVRIEPNNGQIVKTKEFPDTEPFVDASCQLFASQQGLYVVNQRKIHLLKIT
jgi:H/ACA ribonucleoprotein complex subunit 3